jgi:hypothetical protein
MGDSRGLCYFGKWYILVDFSGIKAWFPVDVPNNPLSMVSVGAVLAIKKFRT